MSSFLAETSSSVYELNLGESPKPIDDNYKISVARMHKPGEAMLIIYNTLTTKVQYLIVHENENISLNNEWVVTKVFATNEDPSNHPTIVSLEQI